MSDETQHEFPEFDNTKVEELLDEEYDEPETPTEPNEEPSNGEPNMAAVYAQLRVNSVQLATTYLVATNQGNKDVSTLINAAEAIFNYLVTPPNPDSPEPQMP